MKARALAAVSLAIAFALPLAAQATTLVSYVAKLDPLSGSGVSGRADLTLDTDTGMLDVRLRASGLAPNQLHVQHIHGTFGPDGKPTQAVTPSFSAGSDTDGDGIIELAEGVPSYGPIVLSLTDAAGGFPMAPKGRIDYFHTFDLSKTDAFAGNPLPDDPDNKFTVADLLPLNLREIVVHGGFLADGQGFGPGEANGVAGYKTVLPVAAGAIAPVPLPAGIWLLGAAIGGLGVLRARRHTAT
jgi:hypothetical protein